MVAKQSIWANKIRVAWQKSVTAIFDVGKLLIAAKAALPRGKFRAMVENELPFRPRTAERLMAIAQDKRLTKATHVSLLPASWGTLYAITQLTDLEFESAIASGNIHPEVTRADVEAIIAARPFTKDDPEPGSVTVRYVSNRESQVAQSSLRPLIREVSVPLASTFDIKAAAVRGGADHLITTLVQMNSATLEKAVELLDGERQADRANFVEAARKIVTALRDRRARD